MKPATFPAAMPARLALGILATACMLTACNGRTQRADATATADPDIAVARGRIDIEGGLLVLASPRDGILDRVAVHEGDEVKQGQVLATLDTHSARLAVDAARVQLEQAKVQLALDAVKHSGAKRRADRLVAAAAAGAGDGQSADDARDASAQLSAEHDSNRAAADMAALKLTEAKYELAQRTLLSPVAGTVVRVSAQLGTSVSPNSGALFTLLPDTPRIVRAELNESFVTAIRPVAIAEVATSDNAKGGRRRAHVVRIGQVYGPMPNEGDASVRDSARTVECVLAFDQPQAELRIGQRVIVHFPRNPTP